MPRLLDRSRQIPQGFQFYEPSTKWKPLPWSSFDTIVDGVLYMRRANPYLAQKNKWNMDRNSIADEVDAYNAAICKAHGWDHFIDGGDLPNPSQRPHSLLRSGANVVAGAKTLAAMFGEGGKPVVSEEADRRAKICVDCPQNGKGDWTRFFTVPASVTIKKQLAIIHDLSLTTPLDDQLGVCQACGCPLHLKVWAPLEHILKNQSADVESQLDARCWIKAKA